MRGLDMDLRIDDVKNIAYIKLSGRLNKKDILGAFDAAVSDNRYQMGMGRLWDFRDADLSAIDSATITAMAQYSLNFGSGINDVKVAFVTRSVLEYGLARMFEMSSNAKTPISVFHTIDNAEKWLMT